MGFQYVKVEGIAPENISVSAKVLYSDIDIIGDFECSNADINQLHHNIVWSGKSNFVDIPTDCPQRDERVGWTGDIAVFASTACFLFDTRRFFNKWLLDLMAEQGKGGGLPFIIPTGGKGKHVFAYPGWGDASYMVTWADYLAFGDKDLLARQYESMKKYINAAKRWSNMLSVGHKRYIWSKMFTFGDWLSPDGDSKTWVMRGKWLGTAYLANGCQIVADTAKILHKDEEANYYLELRERIVNAYRKVFTNGKGKLKKEFQSAYVCPLYFHMFEGEERKNMAKYLNDDVVKRGNKLATGFMGTPFLLFALSDNGYIDTAYKLLCQEECPSWLYAVKAGATTIWERWDALRPDGTVNLAPVDPRKKEKKTKVGNEEKEMDSMVSFNHFSYGSVGDWLYRRVAGIEAIEAGYKTFRIKPVVGGGLTYAKGSIDTGYGKIISSWKIQDNVFTIDVTVPVNTTCILIMPGGEEKQLGSGSYSFKE
jgi:alpha-L-rhamnosidase